MFNIGLSELILILLVAFLIVGPRDLPKVARALGRFTRFLKTKWGEFLEETGARMGDDSRKERCAGVTGDTAKKTAELLNAHFGV